MEQARQQLLHIPGLLHRMANLMGIDFHGELPDEGSVEQVLKEMWKYNQTYQLSQGVSLHSLLSLQESSVQSRMKTFQYMAASTKIHSQLIEGPHQAFQSKLLLGRRANAL